MKILKGPRENWPVGFYILWDAELLAQVASTAAPCSLRSLQRMATNWPEALPVGGKGGLVVGGLDGYLDALLPEDAEEWLWSDVRKTLLSFQDAYQGAYSLVLWAPSARKRLIVDLPTGAYQWRASPADDAEWVPIGTALFTGAAADLQHIVASDEAHPDPMGDGWKGLYLRRMS